jgi:hypothetical protein
MDNLFTKRLGYSASTPHATIVYRRQAGGLSLAVDGPQDGQQLFTDRTIRLEADRTNFFLQHLLISSHRQIDQIRP